MVSNNGGDQSQDDLNLAAALQSGDDSSQSIVFDTDDPESGAGNEPRDSKPKSRTYSEEEVRAIQSAGDSKVAELSRTASQAILTVQRERAERIEMNARAADAVDVDNGDLSAEGAQVRANQRATTRNANAQTAQANAQTQQTNAAAEPILRHAYALELAEQHGIDAQELENDPKASSPELMEARAEVLAAEKKVKSLTPSENFDGSASGLGGSSQTVDEMSGIEKISYALGRPAPKK